MDELKTFNDAYEKFELWNRLYDDENFEIASHPWTKKQRQFNKITDNADAIYKQLLDAAYTIAKAPQKYGLTPSELELKVLNAGVMKQDIDDDKELNEDLDKEIDDSPNRKAIYPQRKYIEPLTEEDAVKQFLYK